MSDFEISLEIKLENSLVIVFHKEQTTMSVFQQKYNIREKYIKPVHYLQELQTLWTTSRSLLGEMQHAKY